MPLWPNGAVPNGWHNIDDANPYLIEAYEKIAVRYRKHDAGFLIEHSFLFNTLYYRRWTSAYPGSSDYFCSNHDSYMGSPWETQKSRLKAIRDTVRAHGGRLHVVTFPFIHLGGPTYVYRDVHQRLGDFWQSMDVPHLDLLPVFEPYPSRKLVVNAHDTHPGELAHALAAEAIARFLEESFDSTHRVSEAGIR